MMLKKWETTACAVQWTATVRWTWGGGLVYITGVGQQLRKTSKAALPTVNVNISVKKIRLIYCLAALCAFSGGVAMYALFRDCNALVLFRFLPKPSFLGAPRIAVNTDSIWAYLFVFNLPHGLWCLSGLSVIRAVWLTNAKWAAVYGGIFLVIISSLELSQLLENRLGTFDPLDLASYGFCAFVESIIYFTFIRRRIV
jgi:hypothetical protein